MEKRLSNKLTMYRMVQKVLLKFKDIWQALAMFVAAVADLDSAITNLEELSANAGQTTNGVTKSKNKVQEALIKMAFEVASCLTAFASRSGNIELKSKIDYSEAELTDLRQNKLLEAANEIYTLAMVHQSAIIPFGIEPTDLEQLKGLIEQFRLNIPEARNVVGSRQSAGKSMRQLFSQSDMLLEEQLDRMIEKYRSSNPDFYEEYKIARMIVDYGIRHEKKKEVTNAEATKKE